MVLQALTELYEVMLQQGRISPPGWDNETKVSYGLDLSLDGSLIEVICLKTQVQRGKKTVDVPGKMSVPAHAKRSNGITPNFLCDTSTYLLGADTKGNPNRSRDCFEGCRELHETLLLEVNTDAARAILNFFASWQPFETKDHPLISERWEDICTGNLIFCYEKQPVTLDPLICQAWQNYYFQKSENGSYGQCLVTGQYGSVAKLHASIKGVRGALGTGASLVSFNAPSFESYGNSKGLMAPVSEYAAFAYTTALNYLLTDYTHCFNAGDTTIVCWSEHGDAAYQDFTIQAIMGPQGENEAGDSLNGAFDALLQGRSFRWQDADLDPDEHFYLLGLSPNAARLSVRFFFRDSFGCFLRNIDQHFQDIAIIRPEFDRFERLPLWKLLSETVNPNANDKASSPQMTGEVMRSIVMGTPYPSNFLNNVMLRIRADREITRGRAAIIKGYYTRLLRRGNTNIYYPKEDVLQMELNKNSTNIPYTLGRLFYTYEQIQEAAIPKINSTIRDKYFNSASCTPAAIFPLLGNLAQKHLRVIRREHPGFAVILEKRLGELMLIIGDEFPARLVLPEQGAFQLGYYFEKQARYQKKNTIKEETENV